ncbi:MAG TPA: MFS transporter, partial [Terriglobales bacterium]
MSSVGTPINVFLSERAPFTVEYDVAPEYEFLKAIHKYERIRRRDGAYEWESVSRYRESDSLFRDFSCEFLGRHLQQHEHMTRADHEVEQRVQ